MLNSNIQITETIQQRFSCREYHPEPINTEKRLKLQKFLEELQPGPFGSASRFALLAATKEDSKALRGLGTYGFIKNPPAFILGAMSPSDYGLEDYGYQLEAIILHATSLALGTCWLGGTFTKSRFAKKINLSADETMPAIASVGEFTVPSQKRQGLISQVAGSHRRFSWEKLFSIDQIGTPLSPEKAGEYATVLEMVRIAPSASNKQPWRILKKGNSWQFYLERTSGYGKGLINKLLDVSDLQRVDMGIALCHFETSANALGLQGKWTIEDEIQSSSEELREYLISWISEP